MGTASREINRLITRGRWMRSWPARYGIAMLFVALATLTRYILGVTVGLQLPFILFLPAILLAALLGGLGPGIVATFLSLASATFFFSTAIRGLAGSSVRAGTWLVVFVLVGIAFSALGHLIRRHQGRLQEFERLVEGLDEGIVVVDRDFRYVIANRVFQGYRGLQKEQILGRSITDFVDAKVFDEKVRPKLDRCFAGEVIKYEKKYTYPGVGERDFSVTYFPINGPSGVERVGCIFQDITEKKQTNDALRLFRTLIDQSSDAVEVADPETLRFLDVNQKACDDLGYTREELLALTVFDINPEINPNSRAEVISRIGESGCAVFETIHRRKDGSTYPVEVSLRCVQPDRRYMVAISRDISDRKAAEDALRESEDRYRDLVEHSEDLLCTHDLSGNLLSVNPAPARILGYTVEELLEIPMRELLIPEGREPFDAYLERLRTGGRPEKGLLCVQTRNGEVRTWEYFNTLRTDGAQPIVRGMAHDITDQRKAELGLQDSEQRYRALFEKSVAGVGIISLGGELIDCNDAWAHMFGYGRASECRGSSVVKHYFDTVAREELLEELMRTGAVTNRELHVRRNDGTPLWLLVNDILLADNQNLPLIQATVFDITARKMAEAALQEAKEFSEKLIQTANVMVLGLDRDGNLNLLNDAGEQITGYTFAELRGKSWSTLVPRDRFPGVWNEFDRLMDGTAGKTHENVIVTKSGEERYIEWRNSALKVNGKIVATISFGNDVTDRKQAEEALLRNEERFRVALKGSPITVFNQDRDLRYTWIYNPRLWWQQEILGKTDEEIIGVKNAAQLTELKQKVLDTGTVLREEVVVPHDGKSFAIDITIEPLFDANKQIVGITGASMDVARLRELVDGLQVAKDKLTREKLYLEKEIESELGFEAIVGQSPALREVLKKARVVAPTDSTVLLLGETGTGKEMVARSVHALSSRAERSFIKLNCAAVPSGLLESELFGHERGAFTGAVNQKVGRLELADQGTLFLDEIGELPLELQPKLLRVLQDREFERLGGVRTLHVDVRIVAATNRDLRQDIADRHFREDLFYRLNVFPIQMPPLRERRSDIPMLVRHFVAKYAARMTRRIDEIPDETMEILQNWNWPGNVRELENMIERMVILTKGSVLAAPPVELEGPQALSEDNLTGMERDHIIRILRETNGVLSGSDGAASRLGIKRTTLQSMLKRFGIELHDYRRGTGTYGRE
jgi:PAS domain S-box-containing protein